MIIYACPDQYFARAGCHELPLQKSREFDLVPGQRELKVFPAYDKFGGQVAYRRPGYVYAVESGVSYRNGASTASVCLLPY